MPTRALISFAINTLIILSTIHAQDFRDQVGDKLMGRRTIPIVWPEGSRVCILAMLITWSVGLSWACNLAIRFSIPFCCLSLFVGLRFFRQRTADADRRSYLYYNVCFRLFFAMPCPNKCLNHALFCRYGLRLPKSCIFYRIYTSNWRIFSRCSPCSQHAPVHRFTSWAHLMWPCLIFGFPWA